MMRLLFVGGSVFLGLALTDAAKKGGHEVTLLNRGKSLAQVPEGLNIYGRIAIRTCRY